MKYIPFLFFAMLLSGCKQPGDKGINVTITDGKDTLSHFHYEGSEKYDFYTTGEETKIFSDQKSFDKIPGQFRIGIKDIALNRNRSLMFRKNNTQEFSKYKTPFLCAGLLEYTEYQVAPLKDYIDSARSPITRFETYIARDKKTNDTLLFQETNYFVHKGDLVTIIMIYNNDETRQEMVSVLKDYSRQAKESYKTEK